MNKLYCAALQPTIDLKKKREEERVIIRKIVTLVSIVLALSFFTACSEFTPRDKTGIKVPDNWQANVATAKFDASTGWLDDIEDPYLRLLTTEAIESNHTLRAAKAKVNSAKAQRDITGAPLLPELAISADAAQNDNGNSISNDFSLSGNISWEADLWGRLGNRAKAAIYNEKAALADYRGARLSLAAEVALGWFGTIEARQQEELSIKTSQSFGAALNIIEERYRLGLNSALDVRLARTEVAAANNDVVKRRRELDALKRRLDVLIGRYPSAEIKAAEHLPQIKKSIPPGLPSSLLARRPDLVAAELRLSAAGEEQTSAGKNRLPSIRLTANGGTSSSRLSDLLDWDRLIWNIMGGITQPLFQGGRLKAEEALARSAHKGAWEEYAQAVLVAFREIETALAAEVLYEEQLTFLSEASKEAAMAADLALSQYSQGITDVNTLLQAQRRAFNAKSTSLRTERDRLDNRINLYLALGGDFLTDEKGKQL